MGAYKKLVDCLVSEVETQSTLEEWGEKSALAERVQDEALARIARNARVLLEGLSQDQRAMVEELLSRAAEMGAVRVLYALTDQMETGKLRLVYQGLTLPDMQANEDLAGSWLKRRDGEPWPDVCPLHNEPLHGEQVPVKSGRWVGVPPEVRKAFPFANAIHDSGCFRPADTVFTVYCDECRKGLLKWCRETGNMNALPPDIAAFERRYA